MKTILTLVACLFVWQITVAQPEGKAVFEKTAHDFGLIKEEAGPVTVRFSISNEGQAPLSLLHVQPSCGCTTPDWSKEPIEPGKSGFVEAIYNPENRPGNFNKSITVRTDGTPELVLLKISGNVEPRPKGPADWYPMEDGNLRFKSSHIAFGPVMHNSSDTASTVIYNQGTEPIKIDIEASQIPAHIKVEADKLTVGPEETLRLSFTYDAAEVKDWGYLFTSFELVTDDSQDKVSPDSPPNKEVNPLKRINISADIKEDFSNISSTDKLPLVGFDKMEHDFGKIAVNSTVNTTFAIKNNGTAPMLIRKTKASCGCTASKPQKTELEPGESTTLDVSFNSGSSARAQRKSITIITNDPNSPVNTLWIKADVQEKEGNK